VNNNDSVFVDGGAICFLDFVRNIIRMRNNENIINLFFVFLC
jgi:hypothetical protein